MTSPMTTMPEDAERWDAFVCHASEDKEKFVRPLVEALGRLGVSLWYADVSLKLGDSLSASIDRGIAKSSNGIIVVSPAFLGKKWPEAELHALMTRRIEDKLQLLPIWHGVGRPEVAALSTLLADLVALPTAGRTAQDVALALLAQIRPDVYEAQGRSQLEKLATGEAFEELEAELADLREKVADLLCPCCEAPLVDRFLAYDDADPNQVDMTVFECGHISGGHEPQACPHDPAFPALSEYDLDCKEGEEDQWWFCSAKPKTPAARRHDLSAQVGPTEREARNKLIERYNRGAPPEKQIQPEC